MQPRQLNWPFLLPLGADIGLPPVASFSSFVEANRAVLTALTQDVPEAALPESWLKPYVLHWLSLEGRVKRLDRGVMWLENVFEFSAKRLVPQSKAASMLLRQYEAYKKQLTTITTIRNTSDMKSEMQKLLAAVRGYTADFGKKSGLAKALGVPTTRISEWLGGKYEPSGEIALRLHKWVSEEVQRNQKALTVDQHSQSEETRLRHSHENRSQSNRRKT
jgi:plasmid maintenance system antidote protein VapI